MNINNIKYKSRYFSTRSNDVTSSPTSSSFLQILTLSIPKPSKIFPDKYTAIGSTAAIPYDQFKLSYDMLGRMKILNIKNFILVIISPEDIEYHSKIYPHENANIEIKIIFVSFKNFFSNEILHYFFNSNNYEVLYFFRNKG